MQLQLRRSISERPSVKTEFAQTSIQLFNQSCESSLDSQQISSLELGVKIAQYAFCGGYRPHRKTFESHLIGTASVLLHFGASIEIVVAGLLHSLYEQGNMKLLPIPEETGNRQWIGAKLGATVETLIQLNTETQWRQFTPDQLINRKETLRDTTKALLLIRTANYIEELADFSLLYCAKARGGDDVWMDALQNFANTTGFPEMAQCLEKCRKRASNFTPIEQFTSKHTRSFRLPRYENLSSRSK